ncbi:MAG TPA: preprotein translocase subunit SecA, partial [Candidatus Gracilibacteria bacterium]|nr:preprotein translocase subunit SecA [Candidatus Gracilibacteria bacterium]
LNAKHHEQEAEIVSDAGRFQSVTIATNMAGRGTDIKLNEDSMTAGGLLVLGTERHESRRIDNQLRGRSGRQGDPGETQFFVSMDDDLMRIFGAERMKKMMEMMKIPEDMAIENQMISNAIESAQKKVETRNFEIRKHVLQYDDVMNKHREMIYEKRNKILKNPEVSKDIHELFQKYVPQIIQNHIQGIKPVYWSYEDIGQALQRIAGRFEFVSAENLEKEVGGSEKVLIDYALDWFLEKYGEQEKSFPNLESFHQAEKAVYLHHIDRLWMEHIDEMARLRETVSLRAYGQKNPLYEYKHEAFESFRKLIFNIAINTMRDLLLVIPQETVMMEMPENPDFESMQTNANQIEGGLTQSHIEGE